MAPSTMIPENWSDFLRVNEDKTELFAFLSCVAVRLFVGEGKKCMQQMEVESSTLLLSHVWPTFPHVHKRRPTLDYFCMSQMMCKGVEEGNHTYC